MNHKTCYMCSHMYVWTAHPHYSRYTPGSDFSMECEKDKWGFDPFSIDEQHFHDILETANNCEFFEKADYVKKD